MNFEPTFTSGSFRHNTQGTPSSTMIALAEDRLCARHGPKHFLQVFRSLSSRKDPVLGTRALKTELGPPQAQTASVGQARGDAAGTEASAPPGLHKEDSLLHQLHDHEGWPAAAHGQLGAAVFPGAGRRQTAHNASRAGTRAPRSRRPRTPRVRPSSSSEVEEAGMQSYWCPERSELGGLGWQDAPQGTGCCDPSRSRRSHPR